MPRLVFIAHADANAPTVTRPVAIPNALAANMPFDLFMCPMADLKSPSVAVADSKVESTTEVCAEVDADEEETGIEGAVPVDLR